MNFLTVILLLVLGSESVILKILGVCESQFEDFRCNFGNLDVIFLKRCSDIFETFKLYFCPSEILPPLL